MKDLATIYFSKTTRQWCLSFLCALFFYAGNAQRLSVTADRTKILLGEQVVLQLKAEDINASVNTLQNWFAIADTGNHISVVKRDIIDTVSVNALTSYIQKITITSFDSGRWQLAPLSLFIKDNVTGRQTKLVSDSLFIDVLPVDVSAMPDYHPIKDIIEVEAKPKYGLYAAIALAVIAVGITTWWLIRRLRQKKTAPVKQAYEGTALEQALKQIKKLQQDDLPAKGQVKLFYATLADICRKYVSAQLGVNAMLYTSDELMVLLVVYLQDEQKRIPFFQLLRLIDVVKFAKYTPSADQHEAAMANATASLQHIDKIIKQTRQHDS